MTLSQEQHINHIQKEFTRELDRKYRKGAEEHGGDLRDNTPLRLVEFALEEAVDQVTYLISLRDKLREMSVLPTSGE